MTEGSVVNVVSTLAAARHILILPPGTHGGVKLTGMSAVRGVNGGRRPSTMARESDFSCKRED